MWCVVGEPCAELKMGLQETVGFLMLRKKGRMENNKSTCMAGQ